MSSTITYPYTTDTNYTFDSAKIEVTGGITRLRDQTELIGDGSVKVYASFDVEDNEVSIGTSSTRTINLLGGAVYNSGVIDLTGASGRTMTHGPLDNWEFGNGGAEGTVRLTYIPDFTGNPPNTQNIMEMASSSGNKNAIFLAQQSGSNWQIDIRDSSGSANVFAGGGMSLTSGQRYVLELNVDTNGTSRFFVNGVLKLTMATSGITRTNANRGTVHFARSGTDNFSLDDYIVFSSVQHTAAHTGELPFTYFEDRYSQTNPTILTNTNFKSTELLTFATTETVSGSDLVKYVFNASGQERYVTGGFAADSDGTYTQSSKQTEMLSDLGNIISIRRTMALTAFLHSDDGWTRPELDLASITYDTSALDATAPTLVEVEGFLYDNDGPIAGNDVQVRPFEKGFWNLDIFNKYAWNIIGTTDINGHFFGDIYLQPVGEFWELKFGNKRYKLELLDQAEMALQDAPTWEVITDG